MTTDSERRPWYVTTRRWGQTNITELDATRYDISWWRRYWRRTHVQGVIINAGGIVAYYPSRFPLHYRAQFLGDRDLYGEVSEAARAEGLAVVARMDSNRTTAGLYERHSQWFARNREGDPYQTGDRYVTCIHSAYYDDFLPQILEEIIERYAPDGFADNSWSGLDRNHICYCDNCRSKFPDVTGMPLPDAVDWDDPAYRAWIRWSYDRRLEVWDLNNRTTQQAGGPDCLWIGMNSGNLQQQSMRLRDHKALCERAKLFLLDYQARREGDFFTNSDAGKVAHGLAGWDMIMPESMAQYQSGTPTFRIAAKPPAEVELWMVEGFAGGIQPWWHFISAYHEDRRQYRTPIALMEWHRKHEEYLLGRNPIANVGIVWSQENLDFFGRDQPNQRVIQPYMGMVRSLIRARIPYLPVHADLIAEQAADLDLLILPNLGAMSDAQMQQVRDFVANGGNLVATGESSRYTLHGERRDDFGLADLFGAHIAGDALGGSEVVESSWEVYAGHTYFRLSPSLRAGVDGPQAGDEPPITSTRHPALRKFEQTDILPFGGRLEHLRVDEDRLTPMHLIPPFPIYPPETAWMREAVSDHAGLVLSGPGAAARVAYLPADLDRSFARYNLPDHGDLLANLVRWAAGDQVPLRVEGAGFVDCQLYHQPGRLVLHLVNLSAAGTIPVHEHLAIGPLRIEVQLPDDVQGQHAHTLVSGQSIPTQARNGWAEFTIDSILAHEAVVVQ